MSKIERKALLQRALIHLHNFYNHVWLFLEIHMEKIIFSSMMLLFVSDVSISLPISIYCFFSNFINEHTHSLISGLRHKLFLRIDYINSYKPIAQRTNNIDQSNDSCNSFADGCQNALSDRVY